MSTFLSTIKRQWKISTDAYRSDLKDKKDKTAFRLSGTQVYVGRQGSGKTISAVEALLKIKKRYPRSIVVSNLLLTGLEPVRFELEGLENRLPPFQRNNILRTRLQARLTDISPEGEYILFSDIDQLAIALVGVNNEKFGVVYLIDEIHTYFNALESKNIPMFVFTEISQQRKQRKVIIGTSQLFLRLAKPFREQCDNIIVCSTYMGVLTFQKAYDGMTIEQDFDGSLSGTLRRSGFFIHNQKIRNSYDTYQKVVSGVEQYEQIQKPLKFDKKIKISQGR